MSTKNTNVLSVPEVEGLVFEVPDTFFTVNGDGFKNPNSAKVVERLTEIIPQGSNGSAYRCVICDTLADALKIATLRSVAIWDGGLGDRKVCSPGLTGRSEAPEWARGTTWCMRVGSRCGRQSHRIETCALQTNGIFRKRFDLEIASSRYPWGLPKRGDQGPREVIRIDPAIIRQRLKTLNSGPNLAAAIADTNHALELPEGSMISWVNVLPEPFGYSRARMQAVTSAMRSFEQACQTLVDSDEEIGRIVLSGVHIAEPRLNEVYLDPGVSCFTVARPDLHWGPNGLSASENDEMPGGLPELVLLCQAYGIDQDRWDGFFRFLTKNGPVAFVVSSNWSKCYIPEVTWLVGHMVGKGFDARIVTTDNIDEIIVDQDGVYHQGVRLGTVWRQFPIFETAGKLADLVIAAREGKVDMYPEWAHFGNKVWFHLFWKYRERFKLFLDPETYALLQDVLPHSCLVSDRSSFPLSIGDLTIADADMLAALDEGTRNRLVLKITGANTLSARSYGVLMGHGIRPDAWSQWVQTRLKGREPFLVQSMFETGIARLPVWNTKAEQSSMFRCRVLMRPWVVNGDIVAVHACAVPRQCFKVHGMVSMAVSPVNLI